MKITNLLILIAIIPTPLIAEEYTQKQQQALDAINDLSHEYTICASYFILQAGALKKYAKEKAKNEAEVKSTLETSDKYMSYYNNSFTYAATLAGFGRSSEMAINVAKSRFELELDSMKKQIDGDFSNMSILMNKHLDTCIDLVQNANKKLEVLASEFK